METAIATRQGWGARIKRAWLYLAAGLGILSAFNVLAHIDTLFQLSELFGRITEWWRYLVGSLFSLIPLRIPPLAQDVIVIFGLAASTASVELHSRMRWSLPEFLLATLLPGGSGALMFIADLGSQKNEIWELLLGFGITIATLLLISISIPEFGNFLFLSVAFLIIPCCFQLWIQDILANSENYEVSSRWSLYSSVIWGPAVSLIGLSFLLGIFWKSILKSAGIVALLLVFNAVCVYWIEPWRGHLDELPRPPGAGPQPWVQQQTSVSDL